MKAMIYTEYGSPDALQLKEVATPQPGQGEVLVKVHATGLNAADRYKLSGAPFIVRLIGDGLRQPKHPILGADVAGVVEAAGRGVTRFRPGDAVYGDLSGSGWGGLAEYVAAPEHVWALKLAGISFEQAAAVPMAAVTALQGLRDKGQIRAGQRVLVYGASGGVGTFAVQIAKALGAEVTAVCSSRNVEMARALGADYVLDYTRENFAQNGRRYDLVLAVNGYRPIGDYQRVLAPDGVYVMVGGTMKQIFQALLLGPLLSRRGRVAAVTARPNSGDLAAVGELLQAGQVRPVIDRCYPLAETAEAFRYLGREHARGKVIITV
ncbi:MAG: NAD(P)-dependent alcohol dehydrogenase [Candidatus Promineofilum sp.]|nr:NAD(P)-dependent alcohol dehydrogenase [Promineifilum sp.]MCW5865526.1 NAD(P)-dependent alcohol dehydrogenase [Anaerolineae bacterium]